jgi:hypothetical protein
MFLKEVAKKRSQLLQAVPKCGVEVINVLEHMSKLVNGFHLNFNTIALSDFLVVCGVNWTPLAYIFRLMVVVLVAMLVETWADAYPHIPSLLSGCGISDDKVCGHAETLIQR